MSLKVHNHQPSAQKREMTEIRAQVPGIIPDRDVDGLKQDVTTAQQNGEATIQQDGIATTHQDGSAGKSKLGTFRKQSAADAFMCKLLCIPANRPKISEEQAHKMFGLSIAISGVRCLLSYIILPVLLPILGLATGVGPIIGIPVGLLALVFDIKGIRRFWLSGHQWRWQMSVIYLFVIVMVVGLLLVDIVHLAGIS